MLQRIEPGKPTTEVASCPNLYIQRLSAAAAAGEPLEPLMQSIIEGFGFDSFNYVTSTNPLPNHESRSYYWTSLPREWCELYDRNAYVEVDPRITLSWGRSTPFFWDAAEIRQGGRVRAFLHDAARYGVRSGVVVGFTDATSARYGILFNSSISPVTDVRRSAIADQLGNMMMLTTGLHEFFMTNVIRAGRPPMHQGAPLSTRERQCLEMAAHGLTSADIGIKLGIAERTANFHFSNLISKLGVLNRHEAIAKAITTGQIRVDPY